MTNGWRSWSGWLLGLGIFAACGILAPRPDTSRFFTLTPIAVGGDAFSAPLSGRVLGIGPITLPQYLDRPEIVARIGPNEVHQATSDYWAGSLEKQFVGTLSQNLQILLGPSSIVEHPWYAGNPPDVAVEVDVLELERNATDGQAHLVARWRIRKGTTLARGSESKLTRPTTEDAPSTAAALSDLVGQFSRELADALKAT